MSHVYPREWHLNFIAAAPNPIRNPKSIWFLHQSFAKVAPKAINATIIGLYYLAFFAANSLVAWVGGFYETMPTTNFWLLYAGFAPGLGPLLPALQIHRCPSPRSRRAMSVEITAFEEASKQQDR